MKTIKTLAVLALLATSAPFEVRAQNLSLSPRPAQSAPGAGNGLSLPSVTIPPTTTNSTTQPEATTANPDDLFSAGFAAYRAGDFARARDQFSLAERKAVSFNLEYNLGNALFQTNDFGGAILHYLRALVINPADPDARQNLALARQAAGINLGEPGWDETLASVMNANTWTWIASLAFWAALYLLFLPKLYRWRGPVPALLFIFALLLTLLSGVALWTVSRHASDGVVLHADSQFKISPTSGSQPLAMLQPGEISKTLEHHGDFYHIQASGGKLGWISVYNYDTVN